MRTFFKKYAGIYSLTWRVIHVIAFFTMLVLLFLTCSGFGFGPGLNPPLDLHVPTKDDIYEDYKEADLEADKEAGYIIELPDTDGKMHDVVFY